MAIGGRPHILIGTLYCGENEFEALKGSLKEQTYPHWEHVVHKNLPNKEAHDRLYRTFMDEQDDFDLFMKLDADMVFRTEEGLRRIVDLFQETDELDHLTLAVRDWYSDSLIEGVHTFSDRARWETGDESRFVDPSPIIPGQHQKLWTNPAPAVDHSPDPSPRQAFRFGVHRGLKVLQPERWRLRFGQTRMQWNLLNQCWEHFQKDRDRRLGLAVLAADMTIGGRIDPHRYDQHQECLDEVFQDYSHLGPEEIYKQLGSDWSQKWKRQINYVGRVGLFRLGFSAVYHGAYKTKQLMSGKS